MRRKTRQNTLKRDTRLNLCVRPIIAALLPTNGAPNLQEQVQRIPRRVLLSLMYHSPGGGVKDELFCV